VHIYTPTQDIRGRWAPGTKVHRGTGTNTTPASYYYVEPRPHPPARQLSRHMLCESVDQAPMSESQNRELSLNGAQGEVFAVKLEDLVDERSNGHLLESRALEARRLVG